MVTRSRTAAACTIVFVVWAGCLTSPADAPEDDQNNRAMDHAPDDGQNNRAMDHAPGLSVLGTTGDGPVSHAGDIRWHADQQRLEVDVATQVGDYEVWFDKAWIDANILFPGLRGLAWHIETHDARDIYVVTLTPDQTPTTLVFEPFTPTETPTFTRGNPANIRLDAFNESLRMDLAPAMISAAHHDNALRVIVQPDTRSPDLAINLDYLQDVDITRPHVQQDDNAYVFARQNHERTHLLIPDAPQSLIVGGDAHTIVVESRTLTGVLWYNATTQAFDVAVPLFSDYLPHGFQLQFANLPWDGRYGAAGLESITLLHEGTTIGSRNKTHDSAIGLAPDAAALFPVEWRDARQPQLAVVMNWTDGSTKTIPLADEHLFLNDPFAAGVATRHDDACRTVVEHESIEHDFVDDTQSTNELEWVGVGASLQRRYALDCGEPGDWTSAHYGYGFGAKAKIDARGRGDWTTIMGIAARGDTSNATSPDTFHSNVVGPFLLMMQSPVADTPAASVEHHGAFFPVFRGPTCTHEDTAVPNPAAAFALGLIPNWDPGPDFIRFDSRCTSAHLQLKGNETDGMGGFEHRILLPIASTSGSIPIDTAMIWYLDSPPGVTTFHTGIQVAVGTTEAYNACFGNGGCAPFNQANTYVSTFTELQFQNRMDQ